MISRTAQPGALPRGVREHMPISELRRRPLPRRSPDEIDRLRELSRDHKRRAAKCPIQTRANFFNV